MKLVTRSVEIELGDDEGIVGETVLVGPFDFEHFVFVVVVVELVRTVVSPVEESDVEGLVGTEVSVPGPEPVGTEVGGGATGVSGMDGDGTIVGGVLNSVELVGG